MTPKVPEPETPVLKESELEALLDTCGANTFDNRRNEAIIRMFSATAAPGERTRQLALDGGRGQRR